MLNKKENLSTEEQMMIISDVEKNFGRFWNSDFDNSLFMQCRNNFALTKHIESKQIVKQNLNSKVLFSIAIPVYQRVDELKRAIQSALDQDYDCEYEILVVENPSDTRDNKIENMIKKEFFNINYYKNEENLQVAGNWNRCLSLAKGEWVCILHSDDIISKDYLSTLNKVILDKNYKNAAVIGTSEVIGKEKIRHKVLYSIMGKYYYKKPYECKDWYKQGGKDRLKIMPPNARLHNKEICIKYGGYNQEEYPTLDMTFINRLRVNGAKICCYRNKALQKKIHDVSTEDMPHTLLQLCFMDPIIFFAFAKDKRRAKKNSLRHIRHMRKVFYEKKCNIIAEYLDVLVKKIKIF